MTTTPRRGGRPSLGDRAIWTACLPRVVRLAAEQDAAAHGIDRTALLTDLVCRHYGREDLVRQLPQVLHFETPALPREFTNADRDSRFHVKVRPPRALVAVIEADIEARGIARPILLADIICRGMGFPELVRELDRAKPEGLPLAM